MSEEVPLIYLVDDDVSVREGVSDLLRSVGLRVEAFASPKEFLDRKRPDGSGLSHSRHQIAWAERS